MKAIGARTKQLLAMYLGTVLAYGLLTLAVAVPLAAVGGYALAAYLASLINFDLAGFRVPLPALAVEAAIALLVPFLAAIWAVLEYWQYDVQVNFAQSYRIDRIVDEAKQVPGVVDAESWVSTSVQRLRPDGHDGPTIYFFGPPTDTTMIKPVLVDGRWLQPDD